MGISTTCTFAAHVLVCGAKSKSPLGSTSRPSLVKRRHHRLCWLTRAGVPCLVLRVIFFFAASPARSSRRRRQRPGLWKGVSSNLAPPCSTFQVVCLRLRRSPVPVPPPVPPPALPTTKTRRHAPPPPPHTTIADTTTAASDPGVHWPHRPRVLSAESRPSLSRLPGSVRGSCPRPRRKSRRPNQRSHRKCGRSG